MRGYSGSNACRETDPQYLESLARGDRSGPVMCLLGRAVTRVPRHRHYGRRLFLSALTSLQLKFCPTRWRRNLVLVTALYSVPKIIFIITVSLLTTASSSAGVL